MTVLAHKDVEIYLAEPDPSQSLFLVFGSDRGLVVERSQKLLRSKSDGAKVAMEPIDFHGDTIAADPHALINEIHAIGLFDCEPRPIRIELGSRSIIPALEMLAGAPRIDRFIVIRAGEINRDSPLRKWFEQHDFAVAIECHTDQTRDIQSLLQLEFAAARVVIEADARDFLIAKLGEDRFLTRMDIEKLLLYIKGEERISPQHVGDIFQSGSPVDIDKIITVCFSGNLGETTEGLNKLSVKPNDCAWFAAAILRYALSIHRVRADLDAGATFDGAIQAFLRLVSGYSRKNEIATQLQRISDQKALNATKAIYFAVKKTRQDAFLVEGLLSRISLSIAQSVQHQKIR